MKNLKKTVGILLLALTPLISSAQSEKSIEKGNVLINPGITLGWYNYGYGLNQINIIPPVSLNFEYAGSDYFSFGVEADYGRRRYRDNFFVPGGNEYDYVYKGLGARVSFHYLDLLKELIGENMGGVNTSNLDFYLGASYGIVVTNSVRKWTDPTDNIEKRVKTFNSTMNFGYFAGFRYYFSSSFGAFLETGRNSLGWAKVGLTFKF